MRFLSNGITETSSWLNVKGSYQSIEYGGGGDLGHKAIFYHDDAVWWVRLNSDQRESMITDNYISTKISVPFRRISRDNGRSRIVTQMNNV